MSLIMIGNLIGECPDLGAVIIYQAGSGCWRQLIEAILTLVLEVRAGQFNPAFG